MPITIHNELPCIDLTLAPHENASAVSLAVLWDSCAAFNSGNLQFYCWIMSKYPHLVSEFIMLDDKNPCEPVKLSGAVTHPDNYGIDTHGQLTGIIRYFTLYQGQHNHPSQSHSALEKMLLWTLSLDGQPSWTWTWIYLFAPCLSPVILFTTISHPPAGNLL